MISIGKISSNFGNIKTKICTGFNNTFQRFTQRGDYFESSVIDIYSKGSYPSCVLSNFCKSKFYFDGVQINSMEGFLQSLKTPDISKQREICKLVGSEAKKAGNQLVENGYDRAYLYWNGKKISRNSEEYQKLLNRVFQAKYNQDSVFRKALKATKDKKLVHSIGIKDMKDTILTESEFIDNLNKLRG